MEIISGLVQEGNKNILNSFDSRFMIDDTVNKIDDEYAIEAFFHGKSLNNAYKFFKNKNINFIDEITTDLCLEYCLSRGVGNIRVVTFKEILTRIYIDYNDKIKLRYSIFDIKFWFSNPNDHYIREYFEEESAVLNVWDITDDHINSFAKDRRLKPVLTSKIRSEIEKCKNNV